LLPSVDRPRKPSLVRVQYVFPSVDSPRKPSLVRVQYVFPSVDSPRKPPVNRRCHNVELRTQPLDDTGVWTSLQVMFPVGCWCVLLCCTGVDFWYLGRLEGGLPPDIHSINDEMSVIITF
jgi:hypothetical protein